MDNTYFSIDKIRIFTLTPFLLFGQVFTLQIFLLLLPIHLQDLGILNWQIGLIMGLFPLTALCLSIPFGIFSDKVVPKYLITLGLILLAAMIFGLSYAQTFVEFIILFLVGGIGVNLFYVSLMSLFYKTFGKKNRGKKLSTLTMAQTMGYGSGPYIAGIIIAGSSFLAVFNTAFLLIIPFILASLFLKKTKGIEFDIKQYKKDLGNKNFRIIFIAFFFLALHYGAEQMSHTLFLKNVVGLDFFEIGIVFIWIMIVTIVASPIGGWLIDRSGKEKTIIFFALILSAVGNIMYLFTFTLVMVLISRLVHEIGDAFADLSIKSIVPKLSEVKRAGTLFGTLTIASHLGVLVGALLSGILADLFGYVMPLVATGALLLVSVVMFGILFLKQNNAIKSS